MRVLIIDDEFPARKLIRHYLSDVDDVEVVGEYDNCIDALKFLEINSADIIFLDINMSQMSGIDMALKIKSIPKPPNIVFTTGFTEYAVKAFELKAIDYVVKPYTKSRILESVDRVREAKSNQLYGLLSDDIVYSNGKLSVWDGDRLIVIKYANINYFSAAKKGKSYVHAVKGKFLADISLKEIENKMDINKFFRVHKSFIVNTEKITEITPSYNNTYDLTMESSNEKIPVSRNYISQFRERIGINR